METATGLSRDPIVKRVVTRENLLTLAAFCAQHSTAVSFGFGCVTTPDNAHHEEVIAIKRLVQEAMGSFAPELAPAHLSKDLQEIIAVAEEIRLHPSRLRLVFACGKQDVWQEFDLPSTRPLNFLRVGRRFHLAPLMLALEWTAPYCVAILESGKARAFIVRGTEIQEVSGGLVIKEQALQANDPRVGWSRHVSKSRVEHERAYFKNFSHQLLQLMSEQQATALVIGCHEDLWGEMEPQFVHLAKVMMGRFHLPHFDAEPTEVLRLATFIFKEAQSMRITSVLREINETPSRGAFGVKDVLEALLSGRVQKVVLGTLPEQTISECKACGHMMAVAGCNCATCGRAEVCYMAAEEGLIRPALLTDAEILMVEDTVPGFSGAAALLRY
jgi:hypothetical protein